MKTPAKIAKIPSSLTLLRALLTGSTALLPTSAYALSPGCTAINSFWNAKPSAYGLARTYQADQFEAGDQVSFTLVDRTVFGQSGAASFILAGTGYSPMYLNYYTSSYNRERTYYTGSASTIVTSAQLLSKGLIIENGSTNEQSSTATVTVRCTNVPPPVPVATGSTSTVPANSTGTNIALSLTGGAASSLTLVRQAQHGTASISGTNISYKPNAGYSGQDSFQYTATNNGGTSATATVQLTVSPPTLSFNPAAGALPAAPYGQSYTGSIAASGGEAPYSYIVSTGTLPDGLTLDTDGALHGTPTALGSRTFTVKATDKNGATGTVSYSINVALAVPIAGNGNASVAANSSAQPVTLNLSGGAADSVTVSTQPAHGSAVANGTSITYTPAPGYSGSDHFSYTATNIAGVSQPGTITVTVAAPTLVFGPVAGALTSAMQGQGYTRTISATQGQAPYQYLVTDGALPAGLVLDTDGSLHGTPSVAGDFAFTVTVTDKNGASGTARYSLSVVAAAPVASDGTATVAANSHGNTIAMTLSGGTPSDYAITGQPAHGTATLVGSTISYTPNAGYSGTDTLTYTAGNVTGLSQATISITVTAPALVFGPGEGNLPAADYKIAYSQVITATGGEGPYSYVLASGVLPEGMTLDADGTLHGTPTGLGHKSFTVKVTDKNGATGTATYSIDVALAVPIVGNGNVTVAANSSGQPITLDLSGGDADTVAVSVAPAHGSAIASGTSITYTPAPGYSGSDHFSYTATNLAGVSRPGTISVTVTAPTLVFGPATGALAGATQGQAYTQAISATQGQAPYQYLVTEGALPAGLVLDADGSLHGTPSQIGEFAFSITVTDKNGAKGTASYSLSVAVAAPVASSGTATVEANSQGTTIEMMLSGGAVATYAITGQPAHGTATLSGSTISYTPNAGYSGTDSLTYTVSNATGLSQATVSITVAAPTLVFGPAVGSLPVATQRGAYSQVIAATGGEGPYQYVVTAGALPDGLTLAADGTLSGTPSGSGSASFTITVTDVHGATGTAAYTLQVDAVPPPVARDPDPLSVAGATTTQTGESASINLSDLVSGDVQSVQIVTQPMHGSVVLTGAAGPRVDSQGRTMAVAAPAVSQMVAVYTPEPGYSGTDSFQFVAVGIGGTSAPATVQINVEGSPPAARNLTASGIDNQTVSVDLTAGRTDGPFTNAAIIDITPADKATATIVAGGTADARTYRLDIKPAAHFSGTVQLRYTLTNVFGASAPATITLTVAARPDPSADATVRAISDAQSEAVRRFSRAQVDNFMRRAESLHNVECGRSTMGVSLTSTDRVNTQPLPGALPEPGELRADSRAGAAPETAARGGGSQQCGNDGLGFWAGGSIAIGTRDAVTQRDKISATTSGVSIGADIRLLPGLALGIGGGFGHDSSAIDGGAGHVASDSRTVVVYGSATPVHGIFIDGMVARGWLDFDTRRLVAANAATTKGKRSGDFTTASLSAGTEQVSGLLRWSVYGRAEYLDGTLDAYRENGAGIYDLRFDDRDVRSVLGVAGFRFAWNGKLANGTITPSFRGEWLHEFADASSQGLDYADVSGAAFYRFSAQGWGREQFALTPGLDLRLNSGWQFGLEIGARIADGERATTSRIQLRKQF